MRHWLLPRLEGAPAHLASAVLALALLIWPAELLGSFGFFEPVPYLVLVALVSSVAWWLTPRLPERGDPHPHLQVRVRVPSLRRDGRGWEILIASVVAVVAVVHFATGVKTRLSTGMTGFDSTWYHGPFATGFFQSGDTWDLHFIAPQFLAWFYPANGEIFHAVGMLAFDRDVLSPLLNLGWFAGCLVACWCIGRPYRVGPWSLALGAVALSVPALADQAGEARNDIVGIFFLLAAVAIALNGERDARSSVVVGLAAGLAAGTKLNFLLPAAVLVLGMAFVVPREVRWRTLSGSALAALAGGGYWYLRNLAHSGNPLPWIHHLGPIDLPAPQQALGGREAHSVLGYLGDGSVWSDWLLPGLHHGFWFLWPLLLGAALAGLVAAVLRFRGDRTLALAGLVGLAAAAAWLIAPTSASGPEGMPRGFESGLRYLAPALVLGLTLLPLGVRLPFVPHRGQKVRRTFCVGPRVVAWVGVVVTLVVVGTGYPVQRHYLEGRYADPSFTAPGLNAAFAWARDVEGARIATTSTRQYPLFGTDLSNRVEYLGLERPHGGFEAPRTCREYRRLLAAGDFDYVVATGDRVEAGKPAYPPAARWTEGPGARVVLKKPPTVVFALEDVPGPAACR
jgi:hypothetical protein